MRIDAHQHYWRYDPVEYDWIDETMTPLRRDFLPEDVAPDMAAMGFDAAVAVQASQTPIETRRLLDLADRYSSVAGVVGWVDVQAVDLERQLEALVAHPRLVGLRHIVQSEPDDFLARPAFRRGIAALERHDLPYDVLIYERQMPAAIDFVRAFPRQRFVLDHVGKPDIRRGRIDAWQTQLRRLAELPNVCCKLSGLVTEADWRTWTAGRIRPYIETACEAFGPDRLMIGSDWPVCTLAADYARTMTLVIDALADWSEAERDAVLGGTATRFWKLRERNAGSR
jgi:L-fuconolactonase